MDLTAFIHTHRVNAIILLLSYVYGYNVHPATDEQNFRDGAFFYRFTSDDGLEDPKERERRLTMIPSKIDFTLTSVGSCRTITVSGQLDVVCVVTELPVYLYTLIN